MSRWPPQVLFYEGHVLVKHPVREALRQPDGLWAREDVVIDERLHRGPDKLTLPLLNELDGNPQFGFWSPMMWNIRWWSVISVR